MNTFANVANEIHVLERDYCLSLDAALWPPDTLRLESSSRELAAATSRDHAWLAESWKRVFWEDVRTGFLGRRLCKRFHHDSEQEAVLHEAIARFPSAPLFGMQRKRDYQVRMRPVHQHTIRILTACGTESEPQELREGVQRVFLLFNGLNEIQHFNLYYDMAAMIIGGRRDVACLIFPSPGHLTRYPMIGNYAEKPLQRFINDPGELFRQYLRFMIEIQWLLSALVPVSRYPVAPGIHLLAEEVDPYRSRCNATVLGGEIASAWRMLHDRSLEALEESEESDVLKELRKAAERVTEESICASIVALRRLVTWRTSPKPLIEFDQRDPLPPPHLHVVGYSLGAYFAQSVFFSWPFAVNSCSTVCAGAALRDLRPVKLAHEEEWRSITHGLKYELESGMLEGRLRLEVDDDSRSSIFGIPPSLFSSLYQIFSDVFLQEPHGSYRTRVSEFSPRLLFVVGGNDPIVSSSSVLQASPAEGVNLIEIANLSHFVAVERGEWSSFWLPTVARVIFSLAEHSEVITATSVLSNLWDKDTIGPLGGLRNSETTGGPAKRPVKTSRARRDAIPLDSSSMLDVLEEVVENLRASQGFLFILRNQIPFALMGTRVLHRRGGVPHYEDFRVRRFWQELQQRRGTLVECADRVTLVLPARLESWFMRRPSVLSAKQKMVTHESAERDWLREIWKDFFNEWKGTGALLKFNANEPEQFPDEGYELERIVRRSTFTPADLPVINSLPDIWIGLSETARFRLSNDRLQRSIAHDGLVKTARELYKEQRGIETIRTEMGLVEELLARGDLRLIRVSAADSNPRFLGEQLLDLRDVSDAIVHSALALERSVPWASAADPPGT